MLTAIEVDSPRSQETLRLPLEESFELGERLNYFIRDMTGLDPVSAEISKTNLSGIDGVYIQHTRVGVRNIVFTLGMNPDYETTTIKSLRDNLYRYFMPQSPVTLRFLDNEYSSVSIEGVVEELTFPLFTSKPVASISILCPNPYFTSLDDIVHDFNTTAQSNQEEILYNGSSSGGFQLAMNPKMTLGTTQYLLSVQGTIGPAQEFRFGTEINNGEMLWLDTRPGHRRLYLQSGSVTRNLLHTINLGSKWPLLQPGLNYLRFYAVMTSKPYRISYKEMFGGL